MTATLGDPRRRAQPRKKVDLTTVSRSADVARRAIATRDDDIRAARRNGGSLRAIGAAAKLSHTAIAKIVARADGD